MATDLKFDPLTGDLVLDETGDLVLESGPEEVAEHMTTQLDTPRGQHSIDLRFGLPFFEAFFVKRPNIGALTSIVRGALLSRPDVIAVPKLELTLNGSTRLLDVDFEAETTEGLAASFVEI